jgi:hypothetical protein
MKLKYTVAGVTQDQVEVDAVVAGQTIRAKIPAWIVEMVSEDGSMGHTFRFTGEFDAEAYVVGAEVEVSFDIV